MTDLYLNGVLVDLSTEVGIKMIQENTYFTKSSSYTYNISLPLRSKTNQIVFGHINRADVAKRAVTFNATLISQGQTLLRGTATITELKDETVEIQLLSGNSEFNFFTRSEGVYIDEMDLGEQPTSLFYYYTENNFKSLYTPTYPNGNGCLCPVYNSTDSKIYNDMKPVIHTDGVSRYYLLGTFPGYTRVCAQPYLCYVIKKVIEVLGYTLSQNDIENTVFKNLYICSTKVSNKYADALPHWKANDFFTYLENFMGVITLVDEGTKQVRILFAKNFFDKEQPVTLNNVSDELSASIDEDETRTITDGNIGYDISGWGEMAFVRLSDEVLAAATINTYDTYALMQQAIAGMTYDQKKKIIFETEGRRYIWMKEDTNEYLKEVDQYRNLIRLPDKKDLDVELKIVPVEIIETEIDLLRATSAFMDVSVTTELIGKVMVQMPVMSGSSFASDYANQVALQDLIEDTVEQEETVDLMQVAFFNVYKGITANSVNHFFPVPFTDCRSGLFSDLPQWSLRFYGSATETYLGHEVYTGLAEINSAVEETKIVISRKKFDPKAVYIINNKRYVCKKIEMTVTATGPAPTQRFILYELLE